MYFMMVYSGLLGPVYSGLLGKKKKLTSSKKKPAELKIKNKPSTLLPSIGAYSFKLSLFIKWYSSRPNGSTNANMEKAAGPDKAQ